MAASSCSSPSRSMSRISSTSSGRSVTDIPSSSGKHCGEKQRSGAVSSMERCLLGLPRLGVSPVNIIFLTPLQCYSLLRGDHDNCISNVPELKNTALFTQRGTEKNVGMSLWDMRLSL